MTIGIERALHDEFEELAAEWRRDTAPYSSSLQIAMNSAYQRIIGLGPSALPHICRALETRPEHWFWALNALTGADPVPAEERGNLVAMQTRWLDWARNEGII